MPRRSRARRRSRTTSTAESAKPTADGPTPAEQFPAITRRGNATLTQAREQWTGQAGEIGTAVRERAGHAWENPEHVLDAVFDLVIRLVDQQREFARGVLRATSQIRRSAGAGIQDSVKAVDLEVHHATSWSERRAS